MRVDVRETPKAYAYRCYVNGKDVSDACFAADDVEGWADCYVQNEAGRKARPIQVERLTGEVRLVLRG